MSEAIQITNPELRVLDERVADFYKLAARYFQNMSNMYGRQIYKEQLGKLLTDANKLRPESEFDELVLKNIMSNLGINDVFIGFLTDPDFPLTVEKFIDHVAGEGAWEYLEQTVRSPPDELRWKYGEQNQQRSFNSVVSYSDEAKQAATAWKSKIKEDILRHGKAKGYLPEDFDITLVLITEGGGGAYSSYNPTTKTFTLSAIGFEYLNRDGKIVAIPGAPYTVAFHEIFGHAAHHVRSENLPKSLRFTSEVGYITPTKPVTEGLAIVREEGAYEFLRENADRLGLTKQDIELTRIANDLNNRDRAALMYFALLKDKELKEEGFDSYKHILELTKNPVIAADFKHDFKSKFSDASRMFGHAFGKFHYARMEEAVKREFGEEFLQKEKEKLNRAATTGVWSWEVYPEAVCYFLRQASD